MTKKINGHEIESEWVVWFVEYTIDGEPFLYEADDEDDARLILAVTSGRLLIRRVFETALADAPG